MDKCPWWAYPEKKLLQAAFAHVLQQNFPIVKKHRYGSWEYLEERISDNSMMLNLGSSAPPKPICTIAAVFAETTLVSVSTHSTIRFQQAYLVQNLLR